jgi:hypothetical protein
MPGVNLASLNAGLEIIQALPTLASVDVGPLAALTAGAPVVDAEPPLACYVFASCPPTTALTVKATPGRAVVHRRTRLRFVVTVDVDGVVSPVPGATILVGKRRRALTADSGRAGVTLAFGTSGRHKLIATANEYEPGRATIVVSRSRSRPR